MLIITVGGVLCKVSSAGRIWIRLYVHTQTHTRVTHLHLYFSIYVENHEFKLILQLGSNISGFILVFSLHICESFS